MNCRRFRTQLDLKWPRGLRLLLWAHASRTAHLKHTVRDAWVHMHVNGDRQKR